jgi:hypothetical protein
MLQGDGKHRPYPHSGQERIDVRVGAMLAIVLA